MIASSEYVASRRASGTPSRGATAETTPGSQQNGLRTGFRSSEAVWNWWRVMDSNQRRTTPTVLQTGSGLSRVKPSPQATTHPERAGN
jgi:hypothetical protein